MTISELKEVYGRYSKDIYYYEENKEILDSLSMYEGKNVMIKAKTERGGIHMFGTIDHFEIDNEHKLKMFLSTRIVRRGSDKTANKRTELTHDTFENVSNKEIYLLGEDITRDQKIINDAQSCINDGPDCEELNNLCFTYLNEALSNFLSKNSSNLADKVFKVLAN